MGSTASGSGNYNLSGGSLVAQRLVVGGAGRGTFTIGDYGSNPVLTMGSQGSYGDDTMNGVPPPWSSAPGRQPGFHGPI